MAPFRNTRRAAEGRDTGPDLPSIISVHQCPLTLIVDIITPIRDQNRDQTARGKSGRRTLTFSVASIVEKAHLFGPFVPPAD